jgi:hypothetical protein
MDETGEPSRCVPAGSEKGLCLRHANITWLCLLVLLGCLVRGDSEASWRDVAEYLRTVRHHG